MIEVVLELGMTQSVKEGDGFVVGYPDTDARHEASLDYLAPVLAAKAAPKVVKIYPTADVLPARLAAPFPTSLATVLRGCSAVRRRRGPAIAWETLPR